MKNLKKVMCLGTSLLMVLSLAACGGSSAPATTAAPAETTAAAAETTAAAAETTAASTEKKSTPTYTFSFAGIGGTETIDTIAMEHAAEKVFEQTNGDIKINVFPASQLGDYIQVYDEVMNGSIEMALIPPCDTYESFGGIPYLPYLGTNLDQFRTLFGEGSWLNTEYAEFQKKYGIHHFGFWTNGFTGFGIVKMKGDDINHLFDINYKHETLIRVPGLESQKIAVGEVMNYPTTTIPYADLYAAMQTGVCDGWVGGGAYSNYSVMADLIHYFLDLRTSVDAYVCMMNEDLFNSLPAEYQEIMTKAMDEMIDEALDALEVQDEQAIQDLQDLGIEVYIPSDEEMSMIMGKAIDELWGTWGVETYGEDVINHLKEEVSQFL